MADARLPFTHQVKAKGRAYWFFRTPETGHLKLPGQPGEPQWHQAYQEALELRERLRAAAAHEDDASSWKWLIARYLKSPEYGALADSTQADYAATCALLEAALGPEPFRYTTRACSRSCATICGDPAQGAQGQADGLAALFVGG
jgi:hypothetical protein